MHQEDAESIYLLNLDPEVIKYTCDLPFESVEKAKDFIENYNHYKLYGFGRWAVIGKSDNEFLGWCGLKYTAELNEYDIGFRFFKKYWNQGFATEAAIKCLEIGFKEFKMKEIVGRAMKGNIASIKVLEKIGMKYSHDFDYEGNVNAKYILENQK